MEVEDTPVGTSVRVQVDYRKSQRRGSVGTVKKRYGTDHYTAFEVLFPDGQSELFWGPPTGGSKGAILPTQAGVGLLVAT